MSSFAYQGFGFGEFFKAQQKLQEILEACFLGVFDAPSNFLSLARTLEDLSDKIERLFDENANPNSAILRSGNKPPAQQMLRIASHGLIDCLKQLEIAVPIQTACRQPLEMRGYNIVMHLRLAGEESTLNILTEKFAFQAWKLDLFFKVLRKSKISQTLSVYDGVQKRIGSFFEELVTRKSTASNETMSSTGASESSGIQDIDILQRFQDACEFGGSGHKFIWKLKPESTLLITLHWVFNLNQHNDPKNLPVEAYVNLMKCSWLLRVTTPEAGVEGFSEEVRTMIGLLGIDVVYRLQEYFERDADPPLPSELMDRGDFSIFIDGINRRDLGVGLVRTAVPTAFPGIELEPLRIPYRTIDDLMVGSPFDRTVGVGEVGRSSMDLDLQPQPGISPASPAWKDPSSQPMSPFVQDGGFYEIGPSGPSGLPGPSGHSGPSGHGSSASMSSIGGISRVNSLSGSGASPVLFNTTQHIGHAHSRPSTAGTVPSITAMPALSKKMKLNYSWNEIVDRENLGVRPGEVEILPKDFELMHLMASYTGDRHGRWDNCRLRIFKMMSDKTLRILTLMEDLEESIDQRVAYVKEAELVPDYGYHQNNPVIYIRKTHQQDPFLHGNSRKIAGKPMPPSSLYYKFRTAHDMFNFQFALLGEAVETDFQAVRTVRFKKSLRDGEHSHYKARIQLWREQEDDTEVLASVPSVAPTATREAWARPSLKLHTTRVVMYWDETITTFFVTDSIEVEIRQRRCVVRIKPSSHKTFQNPTSVKARTFGSRDQPGGFRLDKKGLFPDDEENFEDFKWFEIEFNNPEEMNNFYTEFKRALNIRRKERWQMDELKRLAARGVPAGAEVIVTPGIQVRR